jgi:hypothetical protein
MHAWNFLAWGNWEHGLLQLSSALSNCPLTLVSGQEQQIFLGFPSAVIGTDGVGVASSLVGPWPILFSELNAGAALSALVHVIDIGDRC